MLRQGLRARAFWAPRRRAAAAGGGGAALGGGGGLDEMELSPRDTASLEAQGRPLQVRVELREGGAARAAGADAGGRGGRGAGGGAHSAVVKIELITC